MIKSHYLLFFLTLLLDLVFFGLLVVFGSWVSGLVPSDPGSIEAFFGGQRNLLLFSIVYPLVYYFVIVLLYSAVKYVVLQVLGGMSNTSLSWDPFWRFYGLNIALFFLFFFTGLVITWLFALSLERAYLTWVFLAFFIPYWIFFYFLLQYCHVRFFYGERNKIIRNQLGVFFKRSGSWGALLLWDVVLGFLLYLFSNLIHVVLRPLIFRSEDALVAYSQTYFSSFQVLTLVFFLMIFAFNRVYLVLEEKHVHT